ncbi:MAG: gamma-glutamyltransferase [Gammaproteobacteria bacterium]|nr:gamma-glutamyltransferase [Gammaproteobacteria bacterium]
MTGFAMGRWSCFVLLLLLLQGWSVADEAVLPPKVAVASAHPLATAAGIKILESGGNAFDAAVAVAAALAVVEPYGSGLGGGGFWLLHSAEDNVDVMLDGRERAPLAADRNLYLDAKSEVVAELSMNGPLAAGIPGVPAALALLSEKYGRLPLSVSLAPAITLAQKGFVVDKVFQQMARFRLAALQASTDARMLFLRSGQVPKDGTRLVQNDLAWTLEQMAERGAAGFYQGEVAQRLLKSVTQSGGIWQQKDLDQYSVVEREPIRTEYHGMRLVSAAPPSSGGVALATILNILEEFDIDMRDPVVRKHLIVEAMRRAYRDRAEFLGDPDFVPVPVSRLIHPLYAAGLRASIRENKATPSEILPGVAPATSGGNTTHYSILDREGNRVAATLSVNYPFGSGFVAEGTGVLLNDEMDDFSAKPGVPNLYGLVGGEANSIAPGKRMLSSMSPTFLEYKDRVAILGTPGGSRIITMVLLSSLAFQQGATAAEMVALPRFHHQFLPDQIQYEKGAFSREEAFGLQWMGHELQEMERSYGNMQVIVWDKKKQKVEAAADPRGIGAAKVKLISLQR